MLRCSTILLIALLLSACGDPAPFDPGPDADRGPCRTIATLLAGATPTVVTFDRTTSTLRTETGTSATPIWIVETAGYGSAASFVAEASAVGLITAVSRHIDDGTIKTHYFYRKDGDGRVTRIDLDIEDIWATEAVTSFDSHDDLGRPLTGTGTWTEEGEPTCGGIATTLSYDDAARTVTEVVTAGVDPDDQPCRQPFVTLRRYDESMILLAVETWFDTTEPTGVADTIRNYSIEETGLVCAL